MYSSLAKTGVMSGFFRFRYCSSDDVSRQYGNWMVIYCLLGVAMNAWLFINNVCYILVVDASNMRMIGVTASCFTLVFDSVYCLANRKQINRILRDFHAVTKSLTEIYGRLGAGAVSSILNRAAKLNSFFKVFSIFYTSVPLIMALSYYVNHLMTGTNSLYNPLLFEINSYPLCYEIALIVYGVAAVVSAGRQIASTGFFLVMLFHLILCLKQLRCASKLIFQSNKQQQADGHSFKQVRTRVKQCLHVGNTYKNNTFPILKDRCQCLQFNYRRYNKDRLKAWIKVYKDVLR